MTQSQSNEDHGTIDANRLAAAHELKPFALDVQTFQDQLESMEVSTDDEQAAVGKLVKFMNGRRRALEDKRKSLVGPLDKVVRDINAMFKVPRDRIDDVVNQAKKLMNDYARQQQMLADARRRAEQEDAAREAREAQELQETFAAIGSDASEIADVVVEQARKRVEKAEAPAKVEAVRSEDSTVVTAKTWKAEVLDVVALCRAVADGQIGPEMVEPNMMALKEFARESEVEREKFGVRFYLDISTVVR